MWPVQWMLPLPRAPSIPVNFLLDDRQLPNQCWVKQHQIQLLRHWLNTYGGRAFKSLAQRSETISRISSGTRQSALTLSDVCWRRICLHDTSACSALEVDNFMRYINLLTYLLLSQVWRGWPDLRFQSSGKGATMDRRAPSRGGIPLKTLTHPSTNWARHRVLIDWLS